MTDKPPASGISLDELRRQPGPLGVIFNSEAASVPPYARYIAALVQGLISDLCEAETQRRSDDELTGMAKAIAACATFVENLPPELLVPQVDLKQIWFPLHRLQLELSDLVSGRASSLLTPSPVRSRRKLSLITMFRRAVVVAALDDLIKVGASEFAAAKAILTALKRASIECKFTPARLGTVRNDLGRAKGWLQDQRDAYHETMANSSPREMELRLEKMLVTLRMMRTQTLE